MAYTRYRFKTKSVDDPRPLKSLKPLGVPYWITGYEQDGNFNTSAAVIVCYLPSDIDIALSEFWDDAYDVVETPCEEITYTSRFPKPEWLK